jgi:hypothetical protein
VNQNIANSLAGTEGKETFLLSGQADSELKNLIDIMSQNVHAKALLG